ncbi:unnamed protein product, partial [Polarella glacialis]
EIIGRNCRFLLDGVPLELQDQSARIQARTFCSTVGSGKDVSELTSVLPAGLEQRRE